MTTEEFNAAASRLAPSRRQFCQMLGISKRTGDAYALGQAEVRRTVALAIAALTAGLEPAGTTPAREKKSAEA